MPLLETIEEASNEDSTLANDEEIIYFPWFPLLLLLVFYALVFVVATHWKQWFG